MLSVKMRTESTPCDWTTLENNRTEAQIIQFPLSTTSDDPERTMAQQEIQHLVEQAIDDLPEAYRIVFIARVIEEMNMQETADLFALRPETVKTRLHRARRLLRDQLEKQIGHVLMDAFPFAGQRCERMTEAVVRRLGLGG
jgi:RNA polymerase sigma-70 factor (ECF subfamily)